MAQRVTPSAKELGTMKIHLRLYRLAGLLALLSVFGSLAAGAGAAYPPPLAGSAPGHQAAAPPAAAGLAPAVPATHGRLSQIHWRRTTGGFAAEIHAVAGLRRSYFTPPPVVGGTVAHTAIIFGDSTQSANTNFTVTFVDVA